MTNQPNQPQQPAPQMPKETMVAVPLSLLAQIDQLLGNGRFPNHTFAEVAGVMNNFAQYMQQGIQQQQDRFAAAELKGRIPDGSNSNA